ncbi:MAG: FHA domain-containing protein [Planctomycetes bacterium]|nr:FHA domain-containing protein [Planctomycetota bacterium]
MRLVEFLERFGGLDDAAFRATFNHPFLLQEGKLKVEGGAPAERHVFLLRPSASGKLFVGRSPAADVSIPDPQVSSKHAELRADDGQWTILDAGSTNGTWVDGKRLAQGAPQPLTDAVPVRFGPDVAFVFLTSESLLPLVRRMQARQGSDEGVRGGVLEAVTDHVGIPVRRVREAAQAGETGGKGAASALFLSCDGVDAMRVDVGKKIVLGRSPGHATMVLPHGEVSRAHAEVLRTPTGVTVRDLGSANGTFLCGVRVGQTPVELPLGKALVIGPFTLVLQGPPSEAGLTIHADAATLRGASGDLSTTPLTDVLQEIEAEQKTGVLEVFGGGVVGRVSFRAGQPCNAKTDDGKGGVEAIKALLLITRGSFTLKSDPSAVGPRRIDKAFSDILLEDFLGS